MKGLFDELSDDEKDTFVSAKFSPDEKYRYTLSRRWSEGPLLTWLMFNPSTATEYTLDATVRRCMGFSKRWGYGGFVVVNLYAIRGTDPKTPAKVEDPIGPENDYWINEVFRETQDVICAWGCAQH